MMLQIYNGLTGEKEPFTPREPGKVGIYVCGMTVYDFCHVGHARVMVVFDVVVRQLRALGYEVTYVRNITDIDDKIIARAVENAESITSLTERFIKAMHEDAEALGVLPPDVEPRATASMPEIITMIETLVEKGFAYPSANGDVYYDVSEFKNYGALSRENLVDQRAGARVDVNPHKRDPLDFVLWKAAKEGEPSWDSPWGPGRPGWHIECSAMSTCCLGNHFDIHGGGIDLKFPHHENEIAQSEAATGETFVNVWMHNGFVQINDEKMSKSLGNFFTVREVLKEFSPEVVRYFILTSHYRSPLNYSTENLNLARSALERFYTALRGVTIIAKECDEAYSARFNAAMNDDFNTPEALSVLFDLTRELNREKEVGSDRVATLAYTLTSLAAVLGILQEMPEVFLKQGMGMLGPDDGEIEALITRRNEARASKNWAEADRVRDELLNQGIVLEDRDGVTHWRRG